VEKKNVGKNLVYVWYKMVHKGEKNGKILYNWNNGIKWKLTDRRDTWKNFSLAMYQKSHVQFVVNGNVAILLITEFL
jgi:hypothetical protein